VSDEKKASADPPPTFEECPACKQLAAECTSCHDYKDMGAYYQELSFRCHACGHTYTVDERWA
jgi:hypothetical protein